MSVFATILLITVASSMKLGAAGSTAAEIIRENWAQLSQLRSGLNDDIAAIEDLKRKVPASTHAAFISDASKAVDNYEQRLYELSKGFPTETIPWLDQRTDTQPTGDAWNRLVRTTSAIKDELPVVREQKLVSPIVESALRHDKTGGMALINRHLPAYYDIYLQGKVRAAEAVLAADQAPYSKSSTEGWRLVNRLGWNHPEARRVYGTAITRRWFGLGHDDLALQVADVLEAGSKNQTQAVVSGMEALQALDIAKQKEFLISMEAAYRDANMGAKADKLLDQLVAQNDPGAIRMSLDMGPSPRERRALLQRLGDTNVLVGEEAWALAKYWETGEAGPRDQDQAKKFKAIALEKKFPVACYETAKEMLKLPANRVDERELRELLAISWQRGYKDVARPLYNLVSMGKGGPKDTAAAKVYLLEAARQNDKLANVFVGLYYAKGIEGFPRNASAAVPYLQKGSAYGYSEPAALLGEIYLYGRAGSTNLREAYNQFNRAKAAGYWSGSSSPVIAESVLTALSRQVACATCSGSGKHTGYRTCGDCRGRGSYRCDKCNGSGTTKKYRQQSCASCRGSGSVSFSYDSKGNNYYRDYKRTTVRCTTCNGRGNWSVSENVRCRSCGGDGDRRCSRCRGKGEIQTSGACNTCGGDGKIIRYDSKKPFSTAEL